MLRFFTTTALALITAAPLAAQTQTDTQTDAQTTQQQTSGQSGQGFLQSMQQSDMLASNIMNAQIYTRSSGAEQEQSGAVTGDADRPMDNGTGETTTQGQNMAQDAGETVQTTGQAIGQSMDPQNLQNMDNIGSVNDLVLDGQGNVRAVLVDIGGFLGIASRQVALDMSQLQISSDAQNPDQIYIVTMVDRNTLENAPEFDDSMQGDMTNADTNPNNLSNTQPPNQTGGRTTWRQDRVAMTAPTVEREGYQMVEASEMSADNLMGANVYDANDQDVGNIDDVVLGQDGSVQYAVIDVGGFLGIGTHTVAIGFDEMSVMQSDDMSDLRIYVDVTEQSLESMPEYEGQ